MNTMKTINHKHVHDTSNVSERFLKNKQLYTNNNFNKHKALELGGNLDKLTLEDNHRH